MALTKTLTVILAYMFFCSSCINRAFYNSPLQGNAATYHTMPAGSDSVKSATYINASISLGGMNDEWRDQVLSFKTGLHRSHAAGNFRMYYGASLVLGSYHIKPYGYYDNRYLDTNFINRNSGTKFFGAYGVYGGISAASPMGRRGEWRYIGLEGSLFNEFGSYYDFRKNLADSAATEIDKKRYLGSLAVNTELIFKSRSQHKFGIKFALGSYLRRLTYYNGYTFDKYKTHDDLLYFSNTYHFTVRKATTWFQFNYATHAGHFQFGFNYRL